MRSIQSILADGAVSKSWPVMAALEPAALAMAVLRLQARGLEMQPNCPGYQDRLCLWTWNRNSTRTGKAGKNRTRRETLLNRKNDRNRQPCEIAKISPRGGHLQSCMAWISFSVLAKQAPVESSRPEGACEVAKFVSRYDWSVPWLQTRGIWWGINRFLVC